MPSPITAIDIVTKAMRHINALASGEVATAAELDDGLDALNDVLETWAIQSLTVYGSLPTSFNTAIGVNTYTMGTGGTWGTVRPTMINAMYSTVQGVDFSIARWTLEEWMNQPLKTVQQQIVERYTYVNDFPLGKVILWPTPSQVVPVLVDFDQPITQVTSGSTILNLPPGYARALQYAVAVELTPQYGGEDVSAYAKATLAVIKRSNRKSPVAGFDSALVGGGRVVPARGY